MVLPRDKMVIATPIFSQRIVISENFKDLTHKSTIYDNCVEAKHKHKRADGALKKRPKSTPGSLYNKLMESDADYGHNRTCSAKERSRSAVYTVQSESTSSMCKRLHQLEREFKRQHDLQPHFHKKKSLVTPWQKSLDISPEKHIELAPGFTLFQSKSKIDLTVALQKSEKPQTDLHPQKLGRTDSYVLNLQSQIQELNFLLEEEKFLHKMTKQKASDLLNAKMEEQMFEHKKELTELREACDKQTEKRQKEHEKESSKECQKIKQDSIRLENEKELLESAFEAYKKSTEGEFNRKWDKFLVDERKKQEEIRNATLQQLRTQLNMEKTVEKGNLLKNHQLKLQKCLKQHRKEIQEVKRRFSGSTLEVEKLSNSVKDLVNVKQENEDLKKRHNALTVEHTSVLKSLTETVPKRNLRLLDYETNLAAKAQHIEDQYKDKITNLMAQNNELRQQFMKKCRDLFDERAKFNAYFKHNITEVKKVFQKKINLKSKCEMSSDSPDGDFNDNTISRPFSAPDGDLKITSTIDNR